MIPYLSRPSQTIRYRTKHTVFPAPPSPSPLRDLSSPKLTKCFLLNGGNLNDDMTPGFKQFTVNILVMKIISLHSDAKTAVNWFSAAIVWQQEAFWRICEKSARE